MRDWFRSMLEEIRRNTEQMDRKQKAEYMLTYYWCHLLFAFLGAGLFVLVLRHIFFGNPPEAFTCILINQMVDYERDERLLSDFSAWSGIPAEQMLVDSDYVFSYGEVKLEAANESSYEKFFFGWGAHKLDAVLMPESFYRYCKEIEYDFEDLSLYCSREQQRQYEEDFVEEGSRREALYIEKTRLMPYLRQTEEDRMVLVFLPESGHAEVNRRFLAYVLDTEGY